MWELRLYCRVINYELKRVGSMLAIELREIRTWQSSKDWHKFRILGGFLESWRRSFKSRTTPRRAPLVWQNFYYGPRRRRTVTIPSHSNSINPTHTLHPDQFELLSRFVDFPAFVHASFAQHKAKVGSNAP